MGDIKMKNIVYVHGTKEKSRNDSFENIFNKAYDQFRVDYEKKYSKKCTKLKFTKYICRSYYKENMNVIDENFLFTFSLRQKKNIVSNKKGLYSIHAYEIVVLLQKYIESSNNPTTYIEKIDDFFVLRRQQINAVMDSQPAIYDQPLVDYYLSSKNAHARKELLNNE
jgi:hypothetical protein